MAWSKNEEVQFREGSQDEKHPLHDTFEQLNPKLTAIGMKKDHHASIRWLPGDVP